MVLPAVEVAAVTISPRRPALGGLLDDRTQCDGNPRRRRPAGPGLGCFANGPLHSPPTDNLLTIVIDQPAPRVVVVQVSGELDMSSAPDLNRVLGSLLSGSPLRGLVLDFTELRFLGLHGIAALVEPYNRTMEDEKSTALGLVGLRPATARILALTGALAMFDVHDSVGSAVHSLR